MDLARVEQYRQARPMCKERGDRTPHLGICALCCGLPRNVLAHAGRAAVAVVIGKDGKRLADQALLPGLCARLQAILDALEPGEHQCACAPCSVLGVLQTARGPARRVGKVEDKGIIGPRPCLQIGTSNRASEAPRSPAHWTQVALFLSYAQRQLRIAAGPDTLPFCASAGNGLWLCLAV